METRIKYIKKNTAGEGYYAVQIKKWIFWKTIYTDAIFTNVEKFIDTLAQIDEFNSKSKSLSKLVYEGWAVRQVFKITGSAFSISFFDSPVHKREHNDNDPERIWTDCHDNVVPKMEIKTKKLFGKECLEPMKVRITIEQIED